MRNWLVGGLVAALAATGIVMIVQAAIPDPNGVIHACYRRNGNLRLVDKSSCMSNETASLLEPDRASGASREAWTSRNCWCRESDRRERRDLRVLLGRRELPARRVRKGLRAHLDHKDLRAWTIRTSRRERLRDRQYPWKPANERDHLCCGDLLVRQARLGWRLRRAQVRLIRRRSHGPRVTMVGVSISRATVAAGMRRSMRSVRRPVKARPVCSWPSRFVKHHNNIAGQPIGNRAV